MAAQSEEVMLPIPNCDPEPAPGSGRTKYPSHHSLLSPGFVQAVSHLPLPLNCYADFSSPSSWPPPVRGARRGKDGQYFVLYSAHRGVPVQQKALVIEH